MIRLFAVMIAMFSLSACEVLLLGVEQEFSAPEPIAPMDTVMYSASANADVEYVRVVQTGDTWTFHVTVRHPDTGWEDYADGWDVVLPDGTVLKNNPDDPTRILLHPHETEQPFTRSQTGLVIPDGVVQVTVRAHDLVDGYGGQEVVIDFNQPMGEKYHIE